MKVIVIKDDKRVEVEIPDEQFEKLFAEKKTGYEKVEKGKTYWYITNLCVEDELHEADASGDRIRYDAANYFSDNTVAENMARAQRLWNKIHRRAVELCEPVYQRKDGSLYTICFDPQDNKIFADDWITRRFGEIYFDTEEHGKQVINEFHDELFWYFTQFKDRADM